MMQPIPPDIHLLLGSSAPMRELAEQLTTLAASDHAVLLVGETGVGKSRAAHAIHRLSSRALGDFLDVECGAKAAPELNADLDVLLQYAGATAYFEEIAALPTESQAMLLGAMERGGAPRIVASSERDLATEVTEQRFTEALYYRLGAMPLHLPPLRARAPEDIRETTRALLAELRRGLPAAPRAITDRALDVITRYHWPGNIRELRNALERALLHARGAPSVDVMHLPSEVLDASEGLAQAHVPRTLAEVERHHIERTLRAHGANRTRAARDLGISRATLIKKIRDFGVADRQGEDIAGTQESA